jgi:hypothetical protein
MNDTSTNTDNKPEKTTTPVPSLQKYMSDLIELMRRKKKLDYILSHYGKTEPIVIENIRRYLGGLNEDMRELKMKVESVSRALKTAIDKPDHMEFGCSMAKDQLDEIIKTLEGYANPI